MPVSFRPCGIVTLTTDFGLADAYAGSMRGVILSIAPDARIVDITHQVPPQQVMIGALSLAAAAPCFPPGTVHVAVVDPGVGTDRKPIALFANGQCFIGPDNGLLILAAGARATGRLLRNGKLFRKAVSVTFHGRDVFAPVAAHLMRGASPESLGPVVKPKVHLSVPAPYWRKGALMGEVIAVDVYGNAVTNVDQAALARRFPDPAKVRVQVRGTPIFGIARTYGEHPAGSLVALMGSAGYLEIAEVNGSAARKLALRVGSPVVLARG